jgi:putative multiple sugar transport system permease protein
MTTDTAPTPQTGVAKETPQGTPTSALLANLREYGLILALIAIMVVFQFVTNGTMFKPVNLSNLVQQNSFIIVMAIGMLLVIVAGHIDLSVGSVAGFIGALAATMMVIWKGQLGVFADPVIVSIICLVLGGLIGAAQGYWIAYHKIPSFIVTLAGMLIFRGLCQALLGGGSSVGPLPDGFKQLSSGFIPDLIGPLTLAEPIVNQAGKVVVGSGIVLHMTSIVIGLIGIAAYVFFGLRSRRSREKRGYRAEPFSMFAIKTGIIAALAMLLIFQFASYKGLPVVLLLMAALVGVFIFITRQTTIGRRVYAMGGNIKAAQLSGIKTERLTLLVFANMGVLSALGSRPPASAPSSTSSRPCSSAVHRWQVVPARSRAPWSAASSWA